MKRKVVLIGRVWFSQLWMAFKKGIEVCLVLLVEHKEAMGAFINPFCVKRSRSILLVMLPGKGSSQRETSLTTD